MKLQTPTLQSFEITRKHHRAASHGGRYISDGFNVFTSSNLSEAIDKFFTENKIYNLPFKCRTWTKLKNFVSKIEEVTLKNSFSLEESAIVKYSHKAGCSCGCSPGFRVRKTDKDFRNHDVFVKLDYDTSSLEAALPLFEKMLKDEISANA